jgi:uncharacterized protein YxjI
MELHIRQRIFSWGDSYDVFDDSGEARYEVRSAFFSLGHQIHVYDKRADETRDEVGSIRQKLFTLMPTFEIEIGGRVIGTVRKKFTLLRQNYEVDYRGWDVEGDFLGWDYKVVQAHREVLSITREIWNWSDTYTLRFRDPADEIPGLLLVLAIDAANCSHND